MRRGGQQPPSGVDVNGDPVEGTPTETPEGGQQPEGGTPPGAPAPPAPGQVPTSEPSGNTNGTPPETPEEPELPADADLDALYHEDGSPRYVVEDEEGNDIACDAQGNPIPSTRPQAPAAPPTGTKVPTSEPPKGEQKKREFLAPFAGGILTAEEAEAAAEFLDPKALQIVQVMASRIADRTLAARDQQRAAAREAGIPDSLLDASGAYEQYVPAEQRGTPSGAIAAATMALLREAQETGDFTGTLAKYAAKPEAPAAPRAPRTPPLVPPSVRPFNPNPGGDRRVVRTRGNGDPINELFHEDGIDGDVIAIIRRERGK